MKLPTNIYNQMLEHARTDHPLEACGLLAGNGDAVSVYYRMTNTDSSGEHFMMDAAEQFAAVKKMRKAGIEMLGIFHSHPETPARLSDEDIRLALTPQVAHVILSLARPARPDIKAFTVTDGIIEEKKIEIVD